MCDNDPWGDRAAFDSRIWRKARKAHLCCACNDTIRVRDRYHLTTSARDRGDYPERFIHCARCWAICEALWKAGAGTIRSALDCELTWGDADTEQLGPLPPEVAALAFMTADEAQATLRKVER